MTQNGQKVLDLAALDVPLDPVRFVQDGPLHPFLHLDAAGEQLVMGLAGAVGDERRKQMEAIVGRCIPSAPKEQIEALPFWKLDLLITLAGSTVRTVEEYMGKFRGVAPTAEASASETPSATLSPA